MGEWERVNREELGPAGGESKLGVGGEGNVGGEDKANDDSLLASCGDETNIGSGSVVGSLKTIF